jgi:hypothetical protein
MLEAQLSGLGCDRGRRRSQHPFRPALACSVRSGHGPDGVPTFTNTHQQTSRSWRIVEDPWALVIAATKVCYAPKSRQAVERRRTPVGRRASSPLPSVTPAISLSTADEQLDGRSWTIGRGTNGHVARAGHVATARITRQDRDARCSH